MITLHRCSECGWVTTSGSIHGCVSCLTKREPEPFKVVPAERLADADRTIAWLTEQNERFRAELGLPPL